MYFSQNFDLKLETVVKKKISLLLHILLFLALILFYMFHSVFFFFSVRAHLLVSEK